jgi:hypothetical protein
MWAKSKDYSMSESQDCNESKLKPSPQVFMMCNKQGIISETKGYISPETTPE